MTATLASQSGMRGIFTQDGSADTPEGGVHRVGGRHISKTITLSANNTTAAEPVFGITGTVQILGIHAEVIDTTTFTNCTAVSFSLYDQTISVPITSAAGSTLSGMAVGTFLIRQDDATNAIAVANNATGVVTESASIAKSYKPFLVTAKTGADTGIVFNYTTTDAPINAQIKVDVVYAIIDNGAITAI